MIRTARSPRPPRVLARSLPGLTAILVLASTTAMSAALSNASRIGAPGMPEPFTSSLLVASYETFLRDQDVDAFRRSVELRYTEGTLARLAQSGDTQARRAAVMALGLVGSFDVNEVVARALRDGDPTVRRLADVALWSIWFRADTPEHNAILDQVRDLNARQRFDDAEELATRLVARAPRFAEAYNQRAIALFLQGRLEESAADCRRVLELNPYHSGALSGLGQCYLRLGQRRDALKIFRRALKIQPFSEGLRDTVAALEAEGK